jgi:hypothetical protein
MPNKSPSPGETEAAWPFESPDVRPRRAAPAWALSAVLHLALALLGAVAIAPGVPQTATDERAVSIAIVPSSSIAPKSFSEQPGEGSPGGSSAPLADLAEPRDMTPQVAGGASSLRAALPSLSEAPRSVALGSPLPSLEEKGTAVGAELLADVSATGRGRPRILPGLGDEEILAEERERQRRFAEQGPLGKVSLFGSSPAWGRSFVFVIDRSKSMGGEGLGALQAASKELLTGVSELLPEHRFQVIGYNQSPLYFTGRTLEPATPENIRGASQFVGNLPAYGRTEHYVALTSALSLAPVVIFLLTDGGDPQLNEAHVNIFTRMNNRKTAVYCLHFGPQDNPRSADTLRQLAEANGGEYRYIAMP